MSIALGMNLKSNQVFSQVDPIAERFSAAAKSYQQHNGLQRLSGASLLQGFAAKGRVLDIGAGPGTHFDGPDGALSVYALDIALGMLQQLKQRFPDHLCVCGNAEQLPVIDNSIDSIYSNLALQWCHDFTAASSEMARVLKVGGEAHLSIVAAGSLEQLSHLGLRVNDFLSLERLQAAFDLGLWHMVDVKLVPMTVYFHDLKALLYSIKGVGASVQAPLAVSVPAVGKLDTSCGANVNVSKLRGRQDWLALQRRAELLRGAQGLPLTYQIAQFRLRRI